MYLPLLAQASDGGGLPFATSWAQVFTLLISSVVVPIVIFYIEMKRREWTKEDRAEKDRIASELAKVNNYEQKAREYKLMRKEDIDEIEGKHKRRRKVEGEGNGRG